jgi:hypothetical protein
MTQGFMAGEDRYTTLGVPYPDPETICKGQCEGVGIYPQRLDDPAITEVEHERWLALHNADVHAEGDCDGWHFIKCPDCEGTGKKA